MTTKNKNGRKREIPALLNNFDRAALIIVAAVIVTSFIYHSILNLLS
jgi:hypothetical protein